MMFNAFTLLATFTISSVCVGVALFTPIYIVEDEDGFGQYNRIASLIVGGFVLLN